MVTEQQEKYIAGFFSFGHRTTIGAGTSTYLPGTGETTEAAILIPRTGTLRNLSWDCQSNGLTGANNKFIIRVGALHTSSSSPAPVLTDALTVSLDEGRTSGTGVYMNCPVTAGQRVAVFVQAKGGTTISRLRVSFELEAERPSAVWQPGDLVTSMPMPTGVSAMSINEGGLPQGDYYFRVAASDGTDWTRASAQLCWKLCRMPGEKYGIRISWNPVFRASKYRVYRALTIDGEYNYVETSDTWFDYVADSVFTGIGYPPETTTAYINKLAADGISWLMGGNIGIGTVNPQAMLDVQGTIKITDGSEGPGKLLTSDANGHGAWAVLSTIGQTLKHDGTNWQAEQAKNTSVGGNNYVIYSSSTGTSYFEGNVGLGASVPQAKLDLHGTIKITDGNEGTGKVLTSDANGFGTWTALPKIGQTLKHDGTNWQTDQAQNGYIIYSSSTSRCYFEGSMGIGTSTPRAKLDVNGDFRLQAGGTINEFSTDATFSGNSDLAVPTEKAVKAYVDIAASGVIPKGCFILGDSPVAPPGFSYTGLSMPINPTPPPAVPAEMFSARSHFAAGVIKGKIYAIGGIGSSQDRTNVNEEYDPLTNRWTSRAGMSAPRHSHVVGVVKDKLYVIGGSNLPMTSMIEEYDPVTDKWSKKNSTFMPGNNMAISVVRDKIYIFGGTVDITATYEYDPVTDIWSKKNDMPTRRYGHTACAINDKIYVVGGNTNGGGLTNQVDEYDPLTDRWSRRANMPLARYCHAAAAVNGKIYIMGGAGFSSDDMSTIEEYNPVTDRWTSRGTMTASCIVPGVGVFGGCIYILGGITLSGYASKSNQALAIPTLLHVHVKN